MWVDLGGGKNLVALLAQLGDKGLELDGTNHVALRAFNAACRKTAFNEMNPNRLPWWSRPGDPAATALQRAGLTS